MKEKDMKKVDFFVKILISTLIALLVFVIVLQFVNPSKFDYNGFMQIKREE